MSETTKTRTITLTDRAPVQIRDVDWPEIASADAHDGVIEQEAGRRWWMKCRQHMDGRTIVYGRTSSAHRGEPGWAGGELLDAGADIPAAIKRVAEDGGMPAHLVRECIADLPAEEL